MSASPEFFKPAAPAFSPACAAQPPLVFAGDDDDYYCKTPTGSRISYLREPTTCPPAPRKPPPPPCRKRLFQAQPQAHGDQHQRQPAAESSSVPVISLRLDELERLFRPHPPPPTSDAAPAPSPPPPPPPPTNAARLELILDEVQAQAEAQSSP